MIQFKIIFIKFEFFLNFESRVLRYFVFVLVYGSGKIIIKLFNVLISNVNISLKKILKFNEKGILFVAELFKILVNCF